MTLKTTWFHDNQDDNERYSRDIHWFHVHWFLFFWCRFTYYERRFYWYGHLDSKIPYENKKNPSLRLEKNNHRRITEEFFGLSIMLSIECSHPKKWQWQCFKRSPQIRDMQSHRSCTRNTWNRRWFRWRSVIAQWPDQSWTGMKIFLFSSFSK